MMRRSLVSSFSGMAFGTLALTFVLAGPAQAQFWWGGKNTVYDREVVSFDKSYAPGTVIVSFGDRRLYYVSSPGRAVSYPIAVPRPQSRWQGTLRVSEKKVNPGWTPTPSMLKENPKLPAHVAGGDPLNPLGNRALYLGSSLYRIHGTDAPWTIGKNVSKGCVRMHNAHVAELYNKVPIGTKVVATWKQFGTSTIASSSGSSVKWSNSGGNPFSSAN